MVRDGGQVGRHMGSITSHRHGTASHQFSPSSLTTTGCAWAVDRGIDYERPPPPEKGKAAAASRLVQRGSISSRPGAGGSGELWASRRPRSRRSPTAIGCGSIAICPRPPSRGRPRRVRADRYGSGDRRAFVGRLGSDDGERSASRSTVNAHLAPVLADRLRRDAGRRLDDKAAALTDRGYYAGEKSVLSPLKPAAGWTSIGSIGAWIDPATVYRSRPDRRRCVRGPTTPTMVYDTGWRPKTAGTGGAVYSSDGNASALAGRVSWRARRRPAKDRLPCRQGQGGAVGGRVAGSQGHPADAATRMWTALLKRRATFFS